MRIPLKDTFARASVAKRLWMGAGAVAIFIGTLFFVESFMPGGDPKDEVIAGLHMKCDFIAFYTGGHFLLDGHSADLYDITKVHAFQTALAHQNGVEIGSAIGPWWNPPFYAWVFVPIAKFSYPHALEIWVLLNLICAGIAAGMLCRIIATSARAGFLKNDAHIAPCALPPLAGSQSNNRESIRPPSWKIWLLVPVLMVLSTPFIHSLSHGQNTCTSLLLVTLAVLFWRKEKAIAAGLITGLMFYKPQLGAVLAGILLLSLGWRSLIGLSITGVFLLLATLALPGSLHDFLHQMPINLHFVQCDVPYLWDRHVTFKAFWRLLLQGMGAGEPTMIVTILSIFFSATIGAGLLWATIRVRKAAKNPTLDSTESIADPGSRCDRLIAATIAATPLLMPFYFDYDQLLLAIPAVLFAADLLRRDRSVPVHRMDRWLMRIWPVQYLWMMLNSDVALAAHLGGIRNPLYHINLGVLLLTAVNLLLIARAGRNREAVALSNRELTKFEQQLAAA